MTEPFLFQILTGIVQDKGEPKEKKPLVGYMLFAKHTRADVLKKDSSLAPKEVAVKLGELWCVVVLEN